MDEKVRILILEDNAADAELVKRELRKAGLDFVSEWAADKETFLEALDAFAADIVLSDYSVPGFDGLAALAVARERCPEVPVVIVSGAIGEETAIEALKAGATDYVLKQRLSRLGPVVERALREAEDVAGKRQAEERYKALFTGMSEGFALCEMIYDDSGRPCDFRYLDANDAFEKQTGLPVDDILGKTIREVVPGIERFWIETYGRVAETGEPCVFENRLEELGRDFEVRAFSPAKGQFAALFMDITERKRQQRELEQALHELDIRAEELESMNEQLSSTNEEVEATNEELRVTSEELHQEIEGRKLIEEELLEHAHMLDLARILVRDMGDEIIFWNGGAEAMYGYTQEEACGTVSHDLLHTVFPVAKENVAQALGEHGHWTGELIHTRRDGSKIVVASHQVVHRDGDGNPSAIIEVNNDITELKRAEESIARLASIVESSDDAIIGKTLDGVITEWNQGARKIYGYTAEETVGEPISILTPPDRSDETLELLGRIRDGQPVNPYNTERIRKDGTRIHVSLSISPIKDGGGSIVGASTIARDITDLVTARQALEKALQELDVRAEQMEATNEELATTNEEIEATNEELRATTDELQEEVQRRRAAQEKLQETQGYLENLLNYANAPIIVWDPEFNITRFNHAFEYLTGYSSEEIVGENLQILFPDESRKSSLKKITRTSAGEHWESVEIPIQRNDGAVRLALWNSANLYADDGTTLVATIAQGQDITERKRAEENLRETQSYLENLLNYANAPIIVWDPEFSITRFNHAFEYMTGYTAEEIVGSNLQVLFPDESREESMKKITRTLSGEYWESVEIPIRRKDGAVRMALWNSANLYTNDGTALVATIAQGQDITERKRAEEGLALAQADAERRAAEMESVLLSAADGVMLIDRDGKVVFINDAGRAIIGAPPQEPVSEDIIRALRTTLDGDMLPEDQAAPFRALRGETIREMRHRIITPWGRDLVLSFSASPVLDSHGRATGAAVVFRDVSDLAELEQKREEVYRREHHIAEMLQEALVPAKVAHKIKRCRIAVKYEPAWREAEVGGDFYDVFELGDDRVGILIGDVAGKGLLAAIRVAAARYAIRSYAYLKPSPGEVMALANDALSKENTDGSGMLTAFFAIVNTREHTMTYASGGHEPPMILEAGGALFDLDTEGRALGVAGGSAYSEGLLTLKPGDKVIMVTDGITEARTASNQLFGREGMEEYVAKNRGAQPDEIATGLLESARKYAGGSLQDDVAIVVFEILNSSPGVTDNE